MPLGFQHSPRDLANVNEWKIPILLSDMNFQSTSDLVTPVMVSAQLVEKNIQSSSEITPALNMFNGDEPDQPPLRKKERVSRNSGIFMLHITYLTICFLCILSSIKFEEAGINRS